jgi:transposase
VGSSLKDRHRQSTRRPKGLGGKTLVDFQIALSTLLVIGAGLFEGTHTIRKATTDSALKPSTTRSASSVGPRRKIPFCGFSPCARQMRPTLESEIPVSRAILLRDPCVAPAGFDCVVLAITSATLSGTIAGVRPGRGASFISPATPSWRNRLRMIDQTVPADKEIYLICDNYSAHKHERVERWLEKHKRFHVRFTPTSASWLNMIERFFRDLTANQIRRGVFQDLEQLITAIGDYIDHHNKNPKPFIWTAKASDIFEKVTRARTAIHK